MRYACVHAPAAETHAGRRACATALLAGALLLAAMLVISRLSAGFVYGVDLARAPIASFTAVFITAGLVHLLLMLLLRRLPISRWLLPALVLLGLAMRLLLFGSTPILEIDFYRYLWDGAVLARGFNPYALPPLQVPGSQLSTLALQAGPVFERINYRELSTIYPPLAQLMFVAAHWLDPWQAQGLRYLYLSADCTTLGLLLITLGRLKLSSLWSAIYWCNPLPIVLVYNGLHMDILLLPLLLAALWLIIERRSLLAAVALTLAAGIKLWPLLLLPFALRPLLGRPRQLLLALGALTLVASLVILPMLLFIDSGHSGLAAFGQHWQRNAFLFPILVELLASLSSDPQWHARILLGLLLVTLALYLARRDSADVRQTIRSMALLIVALFLLNPVQLPWYCLWFLPLLCIYRQPALLLLSALMPVYFLRFYFDARAEAELFDQLIVCLPYLPPLLLLAGLQLRKVKAALPHHA